MLVAREDNTKNNVGDDVCSQVTSDCTLEYSHIFSWLLQHYTHTCYSLLTFRLMHLEQPVFKHMSSYIFEEGK